jgi:glutaredoxin
MITVYSMEGCASCVAATQLLERKSIPFNLVKIEEKPEAWTMLKGLGLRSMPQIFIDDVLVPGGFQGLTRIPTEVLEKFK